VTIGFVGRLVAQKGCDHLLSAFATLVAEGAPVQLMVVGDGPLRPDLEARVRDLGLAGHVEFTGFRSDATTLMASMHIVAVPSLFEPFGIVAVEAMVQARPVVASAVGGLTETVEDGVTGRLVPPGDPQQLADALRDLVRSSSMRAQMGQAARQRALDLFSPERTITAYSQVYSELTVGSSPP
jgi:glycosyltransferase involved in cell wall biosynthesis